ncbi:secD/SecF GG Motif family protein [Mycobacterium xenopi 4042]|uniref:SecD/SecF GG Motif family protein n=1 Tax=Mycobacterium xenopi 4042 TaxID=1299334 RepID=X8DK71_MYCXE|nr:secD/SecF GG Motif family protein [Mycobacterium xenopi 4042]
MRPARYLSVFLILLVGVYLLVFLTGNKRAEPKLGIDLQGGTRVTLTARTRTARPDSRGAVAGPADHQRPSQRSGSFGLGSHCRRDNLVITVPGNNGNEARNLGQTARLYIRR